MAWILSIDNLSVEKNGRAICAIREFSADIGERVAVIGCNGCGKTTLLRVLAGLETHYRGRCRVDVHTRKRVYLHQHPFLFRGTVLENADYGLRARSVGRTQRRRIALAWLDRLGVAHLAASPADRLSGGERRRVALARALALEPQLLLLDEPLAELDSDGVRRTIAAIEALPRTTIITSSPTPLPAELTHRTVTLNPPSPDIPSLPRPSSTGHTEASLTAKPYAKTPR